MNHLRAKLAEMQHKTAQINLIAIIARTLGILSFFVLTACGSIVSDDSVYDDVNKSRGKEATAIGTPMGSVGGDDGLFSILGKDRKNDSANGIGVNGYLWRASLDTLSFMPLA